LAKQLVCEFVKLGGRAQYPREDALRVIDHPAADSEFSGKAQHEWAESNALNGAMDA
jgi:hypothetical protein